MSIDEKGRDAQDAPANRAAPGVNGATAKGAAFPRARVVTVSECASHAPVLAPAGPAGGKGGGEQALAARL